MLQPFTEKSYFIYIKWQLCYNESAFCKASETQNVKILRRVEHLKEVKLEEAAYQFDGKMSLRQAIPLGLQHVCLCARPSPWACSMSAPCSWAT